jgi:hypothetical protein
VLIKYEVTLPAQARCDPTAWAPIPASTTAFFSKSMAQGWQVTGQPGTVAIPAPYADVGVTSGPGSPLPGGAGGAGNTGSRYMPPEWWPNQYYARQVLWGSIGGVRAGWLVNAKQGEAGRPFHALTANWQNPRPYGEYQATPTTRQPGMRPHLTGRRWLRQRQVSAPPNRPRFPRWGRG